MKQKFFRGDRVRIVKKLPPYKSHFLADAEVIVCHSYFDHYGGHEQDKHTYGVFILPNRGHCSWYAEDELVMVKGPHGQRLLHDLEWKYSCEP